MKKKEIDDYFFWQPMLIVGRGTKDGIWNNFLEERQFWGIKDGIWNNFLKERQFFRANNIENLLLERSVRCAAARQIITKKDDSDL